MREARGDDRRGGSASRVVAKSSLTLHWVENIGDNDVESISRANIAKGEGGPDLHRDFSSRGGLHGF